MDLVAILSTDVFPYVHKAASRILAWKITSSSDFNPDAYNVVFTKKRWPCDDTPNRVNSTHLENPPGHKLFLAEYSEILI